VEVAFTACCPLSRAVRSNEATDDEAVAVLALVHRHADGGREALASDKDANGVAARNVLLSQHDMPKVADFGMARLVSDDVYEQQTVNPVGPLKWMAPEQMENRSYSKASDVFAFGVLLFEIFKREAPWVGVSNIVTATKVMGGERMDVSSRKIPSEIASLVKECWTHAAKQRPSMEKVQTVLHNCLRGDNSSAESSSTQEETE
jgi:serine/threonine protein kinase